MISQVNRIFICLKSCGRRFEWASTSFLQMVDISIHIRNNMYYRITRGTVKSGKFDDAMSTMESLRESIGKIDGLVSSNLIRTSETELVAFAAYRTKEHLEASQAEFKELMVNMMPYMAETPEISFGEGVFSFIS